MAVFFDSRVSKFFVTDTGSTSRDMSAYIKSIDGIPGQRLLNDVTTFGATGHRYAPGLEEQTFTIELIYSEDASVGSDPVFSALRTSSTTRSFSFYPGATTGRCYSGQLWIEDYVVKPIIGSAIMATAKGKIDNGVTAS